MSDFARGGEVSPDEDNVSRLWMLYVDYINHMHSLDEVAMNTFVIDYFSREREENV